jgi:hypothetical protein
MLLDSACEFWSFDMLEPFQVTVQSVCKNHHVHYQKIWGGDLQLVNSRLGFICNTILRGKWDFIFCNPFWPCMTQPRICYGSQLYY